MNKLTEERIVTSEVVRIAAALMRLAKQDDKGFYWITPARDRYSEAGESIDIFNGSAGIILFFLSLYRYQPDQRYLDLCLKAAYRLLQHENVLQPKYYTFYGGAAGILYLCVQLYKITGDGSYIEAAIRLANSYREGFANKLLQNDLLSGRTGCLLAVTHLYACSRDASLLPVIHQFIQKLIDEAHIAPAGLKWDLHKHGYDSLTGLSHGAAGIAFSLLQVGRFFNAPGLIYLAEQALLYEMQYYEQHTGNWMDLRVGIDRMQQLQHRYGKELLHWPLTAFQPTMSGISSWAHGAAGAGISRLSAFAITGNEHYTKHAYHAMNYSWNYFNQQQTNDYSLCSGYGGIAAFFQYGADMLQQPAWRQRSYTIALDAIAYYQRTGTYNSKIKHDIPDPGLFSGLAGVGYWMLGCLQAHEPDSILHPCLIGNSPVELNYAVSPVRHSIFKRHVGSTRLWKSHKGFLQCRQRTVLLQQLAEEWMQWTDQQWLQQVLTTAAHVEVNVQQNEVKYCDAAGVNRIEVPRISALLLQEWKKQQTVDTLVARWHSQYFGRENAEDVRSYMLWHIKELVRIGWLVLL